MGADDGAQQGRLAHAVATHHAGNRADFRSDRDLPQGNRRAVVQIDVFDFQHQRPRYTSTTLGSSLT